MHSPLGGFRIALGLKGGKRRPRRCRRSERYRIARSVKRGAVLSAHGDDGDSGVAAGLTLRVRQARRHHGFEVHDELGS
jgi:hypothetical protein